MTLIEMLALSFFKPVRTLSEAYRRTDNGPFPAQKMLVGMLLLALGCGFVGIAALTGQVAASAAAQVSAETSEGEVN